MTIVGGNFDLIVSGGAAIQKHQSAFLIPLKYRCSKGYGLSETETRIA